MGAGNDDGEAALRISCQIYDEVCQLLRLKTTQLAELHSNNNICYMYFVGCYFKMKICEE